MLCTGSHVLAHAGLLDGYSCTIHWENLPGFREEFPDIEVTDDLFAIDRNRYTCSGGMAALDQLVAEEILKLLQRLQDELGVAYMFITHDLATVKAIFDEIVVMLQGEDRRAGNQGPGPGAAPPRVHGTPAFLGAGDGPRLARRGA